MTSQRLFSVPVLFVGFLLFVSVFVLLPRSAQAFGTAADAMCIVARDYTRVCGTPPDQAHPLPGGLNCPCKDITSGVTTSGICITALKCQAVTSGGTAVDQALQQLGQLLGQALQKLMSGGGGGGGQPPPGGGGAFGNNTAGQLDTSCASYHQVNAPSSNPCEYYIPSGDSSVATDLLNSLNGGNTQIGNQTQVGYSGVGSLTNPAGGAVAPDSFSSFANVTGTAPGQNPNRSAGPQGDIQFGPNGATIYASNSATGSNTVVSSFFGADTIGGVQPQGVAAWLCVIRPWRNTFLSNLIPDAFFDGLCGWRGFHVGPLPQPSVPTLMQTTVKKPATPAPLPAATSTGPVVPPKVQIWAVPATVSVGSRTSVFWTTQGVANCIETSPDGSFNQDSLSGGASTVPLTSATTYTISCVAPDGTPVTDYFTVHMAI